MGFRKRGLILALGIALAGCGQNDPGLAKLWVLLILNGVQLKIALSRLV